MADHVTVWQCLILVLGATSYSAAYPYMAPIHIYNFESLTPKLWNTLTCDTLLSSNAYSGNSSIHVTNRGTGPEHGVKFVIDAKPDTLYSVEMHMAFVSVAAPTTVKLKLRPFDANGVLISSVDLDIQDVGTDFVRLGGYFTTPTNVATVKAAISTAGESGDYLLDAAVFKEDLCHAGGTLKCDVVKTWDFETEGGYTMWKAKVMNSSVSANGSTSILVYDRLDKAGGPRFEHPVGGDKVYMVEAHIRILNSAEWEQVTLLVKVYDANGGSLKSVTLSKLPFESNETSVFHKMSGDFQTPVGADKIKLIIKVEDTTVNYLFDAVLLAEVGDEPDWEATADASIAKHRKNDIDLSIDFTGDPSQYKVSLEQVCRAADIGFGVNDRNFGDSAEDALYMQQLMRYKPRIIVLNNGMKWKALEKTEGNLNYEDPLAAIQMLLDTGVVKCVRGHASFWDKYDSLPSFVTTLTGQALLDKIEKHVNDTIANFSGMVCDWDAINENEHVRWAEIQSGERHLAEKVFVSMKALDPGTGRCLNDFNVIQEPALTLQSLLNSIEYYRSIPGIDSPTCVGIQAHFFQDVDALQIKRRLEAMQAGVRQEDGTRLKLRLTELTALNAELNTRILKLAFATPGVDGILFWSFLDTDQPDELIDASMIEAPSMTRTPVGDAVLAVLDSWTTNESHDLTDPFFTQSDTVFSASVSGFQGCYNLTVSDSSSGDVLFEDGFDLPVGQDASVSCTIDSGASSGNQCTVTYS